MRLLCSCSYFIIIPLCGLQLFALNLSSASAFTKILSIIYMPHIRFLAVVEARSGIIKRSKNNLYIESIDFVIPSAAN